MEHIETERLFLRPIQLTDAPAIFDYGQRVEVARLAGFPVNQSLEEVRTFIEQDLQKSEEQAHLRIYAICLKGDGRVIGTVNFTKEIEEGIFEIGYVLHPDWWGQGLMPEAVGALIQHGFQVYHLRKIELVTYDFNRQSQRVAEKLEFQLEARLRQRKELDGHFHDKVVYGLLREEWLQTF